MEDLVTGDPTSKTQPNPTRQARGSRGKKQKESKKAETVPDRHWYQIYTMALSHYLSSYRSWGIMSDKASQIPLRALSRKLSLGHQLTLRLGMRCRSKAVAA